MSITYYHIQVSATGQEMCTVALWGNNTTCAFQEIGLVRCLYVREECWSFWDIVGVINRG